MGVVSVRISKLWIGSLPVFMYTCWTRDKSFDNQSRIFGFSSVSFSPLAHRPKPPGSDWDVHLVLLANRYLGIKYPTPVRGGGTMQLYRDRNTTTYNRPTIQSTYCMVRFVFFDGAYDLTNARTKGISAAAAINRWQFERDVLIVQRLAI